MFNRIVPESARWLISQRRFEEADKILQKAAKFNKRTLPANWYEQLEAEVVRFTLVSRIFAFYN